MRQCTRSTAVTAECQTLLHGLRYRRPSGKVTERQASRSWTAPHANAAASSSSSSPSEKAEYFEPQLKNTVVGKPEENRRGFLWWGRGRSMPLNPLLVLDKVDDKSTKKVLHAVETLKRKPDSMQLTEEQQLQVVNAFAETKWYAPLWRPLGKLNYKRVRRWGYLCQAGFVLCLIGTATAALFLYRDEVLAFQHLEEAEQMAYLKIVLGMRYSEIHKLSAAFLKDADPLEVLPIGVRLQLTVREMMKRGWHEIDWESEKRTRYPKGPLESFDVVHIAFWAVMYWGRLCNGTLAFYPAVFGDVEMRMMEEKSKRDAELRNTTPLGPQERPNDA